jgi:hypothetical protein
VRNVAVRKDGFTEHLADAPRFFEPQRSMLRDEGG